MAARKFIYWFDEIDKDDIALVGGKGANLGEMTKAGFPVPPGFIVSASAYFYFLKENNLEIPLKKILLQTHRDDPHSFVVASAKIKKKILGGRMPKDLAIEIAKAYLKLGGRIRHPLVAIRSSATAEDLPTASFAGQQETFLNVSGEANVVRKAQACWASLFEARAIFYREEHGFDHFKVGIAVPVQKMIQSEKSGVTFTVDPVTGQKNRILIEAIYGLGEFIVQGLVIPDRYLVDKNSLKIVGRKISKQAVQLIKVGTLNKKSRVPAKKQDKPKLRKKEIVELARLGKKIHKHYFFPQDIEWAIEKGKIYLVQTRPVTTLRQIKKEKVAKKPKRGEKVKILLSGTPASPGIATGPVQIIGSARQIKKVKKGGVLVTEMTTPDFVPAMKMVVAIVTNKGGQTSHAAIVSRELGIPCVVGTQSATKVLKSGQFVTVNGAKGEVLRPTLEQKAALEFGEVTLKEPVDLKTLKTATKVYVNLSEPDLAPEVASLNVDGVGLLRAEFMIAQIGIHPKKLIRDRKKNVFIKKLSSGIENIAKAFSPRPVVYRATDFKTNEYRNLKGGVSFEAKEQNPLLGYRGAFRYLSDPEVFELELKAIFRVRKKYKNLHLMIPFVHQPWELAEVKKFIGSQGLLRSPSFKLWMMVEVPSNVILIEDFIKVGIDGVSIGSNDLTMLILGVDRDNENMVQIFDERDPAVLWALEKVVKACHKHKVTSSICGQAPSIYPDLTEKLVSWGITSISVSPDVILQTREVVYEAEKKVKG